MKRTTISALSMVALFLAGLSAEAAIRINGNQLVEGSATYQRDAGRLRISGPDSAVAIGPQKLVFNLGQAIISRGELPDSATNGDVAFTIGVGLGYDIANVAFDVFGACAVALSGDVNLTGAITSADIIYLVGFVFKGGAAPLPCEASGDVNCSGAVTSADIIYLVGHVFKGGPVPCDACTSSLAAGC